MVDYCFESEIKSNFFVLSMYICEFTRRFENDVLSSIEIVFEKRCSWKKIIVIISNKSYH